MVKVFVVGERERKRENQNNQRHPEEPRAEGERSRLSVVGRLDTWGGAGDQE